MAIKELLAKTGKWFSVRRENIYQPLHKTADVDTPVLLDKPQVSEKQQAMQMVQQSFDKLADKLGGINDNLSKQLEQNAELMERIDNLPRLLQSFPDSVSAQKQVVSNLVEQLKMQQLKNQQFTQAVEKIPEAAGQQTKALNEMACQLSASAAVDAKLSDGIVKLNDITSKLTDNIDGQSDSIMQLSRTFSASDRYLKYILNTQHKRFMFVFYCAMGVCAFAIIVLLVVIILLK